MVDTLAKRYGWFYNQIAYEMYWEDVYEMYEHAANMTVLEKDEEMQFQFSLHAMTKQKLKRLPIPYPDPNFVREPQEQLKPKYAKIDNKVAHALKRDKATPERIALRDKILERLAEHQEKVNKINALYYGR